jgi:site-specific recombinase XerD
MPRTSKGPRYYPSKKAWYATLDRERILLARGPKGPTKMEAENRYEAEKAARRVEVEGDRNTVWAVLNAYLADLKNLVKNGEASPGRLRMHRYVIEGFNDAYSEKTVRELRPLHLNDWLATKRGSRWSEKQKRHTKWGDGTEKLARGVLNRAFNWAAEEAGLISANPLKGRAQGKKPRRQRRRPAKSKVAIADHEHELLVGQATRRSRKDFLHLIRFLDRTGARPAEMYGATAAEWEEGRRAFRIKATPENHGRYKLAHLGEDRLVYVPDDLVPLVRELIATYPTGTLFRNERGKPWKKSTVCARFKSIKQAANRAAAERGVPGVRAAVTAYSYRHAFVTRWVEQDKPLQKLAELLNTSEAMIRERYSHLFERAETLRDALNDFDRGRAERPASSPPNPSEAGR